MKKIAVDLRCLESPTGKRGIGYYNKSLFEHLLTAPHPNFSFNLITFPGKKLPKKFKVDPQDKFTSIPALYWPKRGLRRLDPFFSFVWSGILKKIKPDLVHITSLFEVYYLDIPTDIPTVVTLYDVIPLVFPDKYFKNKKAKDWYLKRLEQAKKASRIITISKSSKKDLIEILKIPANKIDIVYGAFDERFKVINKQEVTRVLSKYGIKNKYILTVSTHSFHKNTERMFALTKNLDLNLVVVCNLIGSEERDWRRKIKDLGVEDKIILTNFVNDKDLPALFSGAKLFLFPSLYEGLGLPVLEAFACGCPVITSKTSSLTEVGGNAALYVNPKDTGDIVEAVERILHNQRLREDLVKKGFEQAKKFSWEKAAKATLSVYEKVLSSSAATNITQSKTGG
ncbi:MAG: glycosyltransferase family 1 protein [Patescibacteria group bacterium]